MIAIVSFCLVCLVGLATVVLWIVLEARLPEKVVVLDVNGTR